MRHPNAYLDVIDGQVDEMMTHGLVKPACAEWTSKVVMVRKGDGILRVYAHYRQLNERTRKNIPAAPYRRVFGRSIVGLHAFLPSTYVRGTNG